MRERKRIEWNGNTELFNLESFVLSEMLQKINSLVTLLLKKFINFLFRRLQNNHTKAFQLSIAMGRWIGLYIELICAVFVTSIIIGAVILHLDPGMEDSHLWERDSHLWTRGSHLWTRDSHLWARGQRITTNDRVKGSFFRWKRAGSFDRNISMYKW